METIKKSLLFFTFLIIAIFNAMTTSYIFAENVSHEQLRKELNASYVNHDGSTKDPSIKVIETIPRGKRYGVCHNYAISKLLDLKGLIHETFAIPGESDWYERVNFLDDYCQEVSTPQTGDLVTYRKDESKDSEILHTGLVHDNGIVESKWGIEPVIVTHPTFTVPSNYGNHVKYHRIIKPRNEIITDVKKKGCTFTLYKGQMLPNK